MSPLVNTTKEDIPLQTLLQKIGEICTDVNEVTTEKMLLELSLRRTMDIFGASRGSIFILSDDGKELILKTAQGIAQDEEKSLVKRMGEGIIGQVAELKRPMFVENIAKDHRFKDHKPRGRYKTPSFLCTPLIVKDELIGVINISDKETGHRFNKDELQLLDFLATQIALNYRRIELYNQFERALKETHHLKNKLGKSDEEAKHLKKQIYVQEKLATIGKLAGGIAHEFNNPLDGVMRYTNLCLEHIKGDDVVRGYLLEVKHGLNRMANIVKNLLACSREDFVRAQKVDFHQSLDYAISTLRNEIAFKDIKVVKHVQESIQPINDLGLERILTNLMRNGIDAMKGAGTLTVKASAHNGTLALAVSDTGTGISQENMEKIFEPFFTTKDIDKGCGLGLTIVGEIVKSYGGTIDVESEIGKGTTFHIRLPIKS